MSVIGFDWDGTLVKNWTAEPLSGVKERLAELAVGTRTFIATNQGGPAWRRMTADTKYPTAQQIAEQLEAGLIALGWRPDLLLVCTHPGRGWDTTASDVRYELHQLLVPMVLRHGIRSLMTYSLAGFRKPATGMLLDAARHFGARAPGLTYIGDMGTDRQAAVAAGCRYLDAAVWRKKGLGHAES